MTTPAGSQVLHTAVSGAGPRVVLAHGFTQDGTVWGGLDDALAVDHEVVAADLPGHGGSADIRADVPSGAALLGAAGGPGDYLGYSMGARHCLQLALDRPDLVGRLVLISGTAGIEDVGERAARRTADEALASRLDPADGSPPVDTVATFVEAWVRLPLFGAIPDAALGMEARRRGSAPGLAASLRLAGTGSQGPLWDRLGTLSVPVLLVAGAEDARYVDLAHRMARSIGLRAEVHLVAGAAHAPHLQAPGEVAGVVRSFLDGGRRID